jgi:hypothetical protein
MTSTCDVFFANFFKQSFSLILTKFLIIMPKKVYKSLILIRLKVTYTFLSRRANMSTPVTTIKQRTKSNFFFGN